MESTRSQREHSNNRPVKAEAPSTRNQGAMSAPSLRMLTGAPVLRLYPDVAPQSRRKALPDAHDAQTTSSNASSITPHRGAFVTSDLMRTAPGQPVPVGG